jgi:hypothetical protein
MLTINPTVDFNIGSAYKASKKAIIISPLRSNLRHLTQSTLRRTCVVFTLKLPYLEGKNGVVTDSIYEKSMSVNQLYCASVIDF